MGCGPEKNISYAVWEYAAQFPFNSSPGIKQWLSGA